MARREVGPWKPSHLLDATLTDCCRDLAIRAHIRFPPAYAKQAEQDVTLQLSRAGIRLAFVLNQALVAAAN